MEKMSQIKLSKKLQFNLLCVILIFGYSEFSHSAACCGGGFAIPSLITGDDKAQLTSSFSYSKVDTDVLANGLWQKRNTDDIAQIYKIEAAHIFADRFQVGVSVPVQTRTKEGPQGGQSSGLGDVAGQVGYEYLPDWNYHPWRPKGVGFISVTLPTGKSIYESVDGLDSRGRGFFAVGLGTTLTKTWTQWDANATLEIHHAFEKPVSNSQMIGNVIPGNGESLSFGAGYNLQNLRLGFAITTYFEDAVDVEGTIPSNGSAQRYSTGTLSSSYLFADNWAGTLSYSDQTILGDPSNATLTKTIQISLQKRWLR
jgi:hypothetical protein